jgi:hypothetical protein
MLHLLAGLAIAAACTSEAGTRKPQPRTLCDLIGCVKKVPAVKASARVKQKKAAHRPIRQAVLPARLAPKPKPKPLQPKSHTPEILTMTPPPQPAPPMEAPISDAPTADELHTASIASVSCRADLLEMGGDISVADPIEITGPCTVADPVRLRSIHTSSGRVELPGAPILNCAFARQLTVWVSDIAAPVVAALAKSNLAAVFTGPGYQCRGREGDSPGNTSEHSSGNAIDISGITLTTTRRIEMADVVDSRHPDHRLLTALRMSACGYFTTVLGPGSDAAHQSHYYFDLAKHGTSGPNAICE